MDDSTKWREVIALVKVLTEKGVLSWELVDWRDEKGVRYKAMKEFRDTTSRHLSGHLEFVLESDLHGLSLSVRRFVNGVSKEYRTNEFSYYQYEVSSTQYGPSWELQEALTELWSIIDEGSDKLGEVVDDLKTLIETCEEENTS